MMYKIENGEMVKANIAYTPYGINFGWYEFENDEDALRYFLKTALNPEPPAEGALPTIEERVEAVEDVINLIIAGDL